MFIPRLGYLNKFCNSEGYLLAFDQTDFKSFSTIPENVAKKHRFYDFSFEPDRNQQIIENKLEEFEDLQKA
ncbi:MAG: DUF4238 domain-containing protein [Cyanobacteria bacterium P01_A01_bin.40]